MVLFDFQGFCQYLLKSFGEALQSRGVVIGFDSRHNSKRFNITTVIIVLVTCRSLLVLVLFLCRFARLTANVFVLQGVKVYVYRGITPTPFVVSDDYL